MIEMPKTDFLGKNLSDKEIDAMINKIVDEGVNTKFSDFLKKYMPEIYKDIETKKATE